MQILATLLFVLPALAAASPSVRRQGDSGNTICGTGSMQCCNNYYEPSSPEGEAYLKSAGLYDHPSANDGAVGVSCSPLIQVSGSCTSNPRCCGPTNGGIGVGCDSS
ncbi:uncharacterized protein PHACADRAFT_252675 [Phanerochaete carnosa HHB-10118-sp]|uniref:Hydrophobin n=1 Tax=Phanerochaete carnosa (strain HHB-10118-sp) TaxID=650164 RepID=K5X6C2_PHACS|nr:uncharacterized protein PHACADRAFT_252675 [Phanerochaete carnosa HHB-10118-sp]EKM58392.1 hypothetical protein PHACADRAFT_252675 [Phanerochaete carnosa HHB-10118-sp]